MSILLRAALRAFLLGPEQARCMSNAIVLGLGCSIALPCIPAPAQAPADLGSIARSAAERLGLDIESVAAHFVDPGGGVHTLRGDAPMPPASCLKLATAAAALDLLGPDFELRTELYRAGAIEGDELAGDLVVVGRGDPAISGRFHAGDALFELRPWAEQLRGLGVRRIRGRLLGDDGYLAGDARLPEWPEEQLHRWFCAPSGALNLNDNCVDVTLTPRGAGEERRARIEVTLSPENPLFRVTGALAPVSNARLHCYSLDRAPGAWEIRVAGHFLETAPARTEWVTVPDPTQAFLGALAALLEREGVDVACGTERGRRVANAVHLQSVRRPVRMVIPVLLKRSQNLYGDALLRVMGREHGGDGSYESGARQLTAWLEQVPGIAGTGVIRDGSGLSRRNRATAATLVAVLRYAAAQPWRDLYFDSLPIAAVDGTLEKRFQKSPLERRVRAKTGHGHGITTLAGIVSTDAGDLWFSLLFQGRPSEIALAERWQEEVLLSAALAFSAPRDPPLGG